MSCKLEKSKKKNSNNNSINKKISTYKLKKKKISKKIVYESTMNELDENKIYDNFINLFKNFLKSCHNLLSGSGVTGDPALDDICNIFALTYLLKNVEIYGILDKNNYPLVKVNRLEKYFPCLSIDYILKNQSNLCKSKNSNDGKSVIEKIGEVLSNHKIFKNIIKDSNFINCKKNNVLHELISNISNFGAEHDIFKYPDIIGIAYEFWANEYKGSGGKELGNFFTERKLMKMCFELIDLEDIKKMKIDNNSTIGDEFCGTFGFPLYLKSFLKNKFKIDIQNKNIHGIEFEDRASRLAILNAMFSLGTVENVKRGDSFINDVSPHLDISVHNVPFGKRMKVKHIKNNYNEHKLKNPNIPEFNKIIPAEANKDAVLASQMVIYKTSKIGLCIIKDGEEASGTNKSLVKYRKHIIETVNVKKILKIPSGAFSSTGTKTLCFYFINDGNKTSNVQFLELSENCNSIKEICNVSYEDLKHNNYLWNPTSYLLDEDMEKIKSISTCEWEPIKDLFEIKNGNFNSSDVDNNGTIPFYNCSAKNPIGTHSSHNFNYDNEYLLLITAGGSSKNLDGDNVGLGKVYKVKGKTACMSGVKSLRTIKDGININYIYYFINYNKLHFTKHANFTTNLGTLKTKKLEKILVPIPSIEKQDKTVKSVELFHNMVESLEHTNKQHLEGMKIYLITKIKKNLDDIKWEKMGKIINKIKTGKNKPSDNKKGSKYPYYGTSGITGFTDEYLFDGNYILTPRNGTIGNIFKVNGKFFPSDHIYIIEPKDKNDYQYLCYLFEHFISLDKYKTGCTIPNIKIDNIQNYEIPIVKQKVKDEIVQYLDYINSVISKNEELIKLYKENIKEIIKQSYC